MGRTMKKVPMDFDWPLGRIWKGYVNPYHGVDCPWCFDKRTERSHGFSKEAWEYYKTWYGHLMGKPFVTNPYKPDTRYCPQAKPYTMERWEYDFIVSHKERLCEQFFGTCDESRIPFFENLNDWLLTRKYGLDVDSVFIWIMTEEYCRRNGYEYMCPHCKGEGKVWFSEEVKNLNKQWKPEEPPTGEGFQLWNTTGEGAPMSPVFKTFEELCVWCEANATTFADYYATKEEWAKMLDEDFVYHKAGNVIMF